MAEINDWKEVPINDWQEVSIDNGKPGSASSTDYAPDVKKDIIDKMGTLERFFVGAGYGMDKARLGALQFGADMLEKAGLVSPDTTKGLRDEYTEKKNLMNPLLQESGAARAGEFTGEVAPTMVLPGGIAGGVGKRLLGSAAVGTLQGAIQPTDKEGQRGTNAAIGAATGIGGQALTSGIAKGYNAIANKIPNKGDAYGIRTTLGEETGKPFTQMVESWLEKVPVIGLGGFRKKQNEEASNAAKSFFMKYVTDPSLATTKAMKEANDVALDAMYEKMKSTASALPSIPATETKKATTAMLDRYPSVFESIQDTHIKRLLSNIKGDTVDKTVVSPLLNSRGNPIKQKVTPTFSFNDLWTLRKGLGKEIGDARTETAEGQLKALYASVSDDLDNMFAQGGPSGQMFREANEAWKQYSLKFDALRSAYDKSMGTTKSGEMFSPKKFSTELKNLANDPNYKKNVKWSDSEIKEMTGLANILQTTKRAGQFMENPPTGARWGLPIAGLGIGGYASASDESGRTAKAIAVPLTGMALARFLTGTTRGKNLARAASSVNPNSQGMKNILTIIQRSMVQGGIDMTGGSE